MLYQCFALPFQSNSGDSIAGAGDVNGDGFDDILIGARYNDAGGNAAGTSYLLYGPVSGTVDLSNADARLIGEDASDHAGVVSGAGDIDGDGFADLLIGAWGDDQGGTTAGAAHLVYGPVYGDTSLALADVDMLGSTASELAGYAVSGGGDVNGDGFDDIIVGGYGDATGGISAGATYLLHGGPGL